MEPNAVLKHIFRSGIVATLPNSVPLQDITKVSDALLASPVLSVQIPWHPDAGTLIEDLRTRAGDNMVVGVSEVETAVHLKEAVSAGAQFAISPLYDRALTALSLQMDTLMIPTVISIMAANAAFQNGIRLINMRTGGPQGPDFIGMVLQSIPGLRVAVGGNFSKGEVESYAQVGASAIIVQKAIYEGNGQLMAELITNARTAQKAWDSGLKHRQKFGAKRPSSPSLN